MKTFTGGRSGAWNNEVFLVGTPMGLILVRGTSQPVILHPGDVYGISLFRDRVYFGDRVDQAGVGSFSRILSGVIAGDQLHHIRIETTGLDHDVHQIDIYDWKLYVADTASNAIIRFEIDALGKLANRRDFFPRGKLSDGSDSTNYAHFNSIYCREDRVFVICHNYSAGTGKPSEILCLRAEDLVEIESVTLPAYSAHNLVFLNNETFVCDSQRGRITRNNTVIYQSRRFTRGLAVTNDFILVGESTFTKRSERVAGSSGGFVVKLQAVYPFSVLGEIALEGVYSVREVRVCHDKDYGLSMHS